MKYLLSLTLCACALVAPPQASQAMTAPDDLVSVFSLTHTSDGADFDFKYYQKKFKELKLDKKTLDFIRSKTAQLDGAYCLDKHALCTNRLISIRILDGKEVQRLVIGNKLGEVYAWDSDGSSCSTSLTGNGDIGYCSPFERGE